MWRTAFIYYVSKKLILDKLPINTLSVLKQITAWYYFYKSVQLHLFKKIFQESTQSIYMAKRRTHNSSFFCNCANLLATGSKCYTHIGIFTHIPDIFKLSPALEILSKLNIIQQRASQGLLFKSESEIKKKEWLYVLTSQSLRTGFLSTNNVKLGMACCI